MVAAGLPLLLGATAGTARHSLALEHAMRYWGQMFDLISEMQKRLFGEPPAPGEDLRETARKVARSLAMALRSWALCAESGVAGVIEPPGMVLCGLWPGPPAPWPLRTSVARSWC